MRGRTKRALRAVRRRRFGGAAAFAAASVSLEQSTPVAIAVKFGVPPVYVPTNIPAHFHPSVICGAKMIPRQIATIHTEKIAETKAITG